MSYYVTRERHPKTEVITYYVCDCIGGLVSVHDMYAAEQGMTDQEACRLAYESCSILNKAERQKRMRAA